jgi:hypothetical protein
MTSAISNGPTTQRLKKGLDCQDYEPNSAPLSSAPIFASPLSRARTTRNISRRGLSLEGQEERDFRHRIESVGSRSVSRWISDTMSGSCPLGRAISFR